MNSVTCCEQPPWAGDNPLDFEEPDLIMPVRESADARPVNTHGRKLLEALASRAFILNGLQCNSVRHHIYDLTVVMTSACNLHEM